MNFVFVTFIRQPPPAAGKAAMPLAHRHRGGG